uniref:C2 domain-containing protein n=1 Tax=Romanomermis culicivorax TaxID=13658 RepID=A0A915INL1_ROMCU
MVFKIGDEVIEWNGRQLGNLSFEAVCEVVKESQNADCVKIIASRSIKPQTTSHSQTFDTGISLSEEHLTPQKQPVISSVGPSSSCSGQIYGKIQVSLSYYLAERTLYVAIHQAVDLAPREDGSGRNPFVKIFLLPDRSENSRRQSVTLMNTCLPNWEQNFLYRNALIDLSYPDVYVGRQWYLMVDMSEDSPLRMMSKSRTALYSQYGLSNRPYSAACDSFSLYESTERPTDAKFSIKCGVILIAENRPRSSCVSDLSDQRTYREQKTRSFVGDQSESSFDDVYRHPAWHYAKNHCQQNYSPNNRLSSYDMLPVQVFRGSADYYNLPRYNRNNNDRSTTAITTPTARSFANSSSLYLVDQAEILENRAKSNRIAEVDYGSVFSCASNKENDKIVRKASSGMTRRSLKKHQSLHDRSREMDQQSSTIEPNYGDVRVDDANDNEISNDCQRNRSPDVNSSRIGNAAGGYQSDESEVSGANLTPKKPSRAPKLRHFRSETGQSQTLTSVDDRSETETSNAETTIDLTLPGDDTIPVKMQQKKKLMNRLVPNKIAGRHLFGENREWKKLETIP